VELRSLLRVLARRWWLVVPIFLVAFGSAVVFTLAQRPVYESTAKVLVVPAGEFEDALSAVATLSRQPEIGETYAQIANSRSVRQEASEALSLSLGEQRTVQLTTRLVPGTNILELTARSGDATLAQAYADAIAESLVEFSGSVSQAFDLRILDAANATTDPVSPNVPMNVLLGFVAALVLAVGLGIVAELLQPRRAPRSRFEMLDRDSIAYSEPFFMLRLRQEMSRGTRSKSKLVVGLINMNHGNVLQDAPPVQRRDIVRRLAGILDSHLRVEDISARVGPELFALLLPDTTEAEAVVMVEALRRRMAVPTVGMEQDGEPVRVRPAAGLVEFSGEATTAAGLLDQARSALRDAETIPVGKTQAYSALRPA
jgi:diguanylate cyclase (GGDEF)-like protein